MSQKNLVSDICQSAARTDKNLKNPMGLAMSKKSIWVTTNNTGLIIQYDKDGCVSKNIKVVSGNPTGIVRLKNKGFTITSNGVTGHAKFIVVTTSGSIEGYNPRVLENSTVIATPTKGQIFTGATMVKNRLYVANHGNGSIDVYDCNWNFVKSIIDNALKSDGYHPLNVVNHQDHLYVSHTFYGTLTNGMSTTSSITTTDGNGYITKYNGISDRPIRLASRGALSIPYGMLIMRNLLYVSNNVHGTISIFELPDKNHEPAKYLSNVSTNGGGFIINDGIWAIAEKSENLWLVAGNQRGAHGSLSSITWN